MSCDSNDKSLVGYGDLATWVSRLPEDYKHASWANCQDLPSGLIVFGKNWAADLPIMSLYLFGVWGSGKTTFAFSAIRQFMENRVGWGYIWPNYITGEELDGHLLRAVKHEEGDASEIEKWVNSDLLFIDDLDKATPSPRFQRQLFSIINKRMIQKKPTMITSNCSPQELASILDGAVLSRMGDATKWKTIEFPPDDLRKKKIQVTKF